MKKTYVTSMPDKIGAFLRASKCFASLGVNITRVSYNKAVDSHTLFIDAEGTESQLQSADKMLKDIGYLGGDDAILPTVILIEFRLPDVPGAVTNVLELIEKFNFNISYMSSQENNTGYQLFKMGLFVVSPKKLETFISEAQKLCGVRVIDYNRSEKVFDNSIFYNTFVSSLAETVGLNSTQKNELLVNANLAMQLLDEAGQSPFSTFDSISRVGELLAACRKKAFSPRITRRAVTQNTEIILIEPPCGSNTAIIKCGDDALFVDSGYASYKEEMLERFRALVPSFDKMKKSIVLTHADVDHAGLLFLFDEVIASKKSADCLIAEYEGKDGYREQNPIHKPYIRIAKTLTGYRPITPDKLVTPWCDAAFSGDAVYERIGDLPVFDLNFEVYEFKGGHLRGEIVLIERERKLAFTGDIYVNIGGMTSEQKLYNRYAPILMTSVDTDPALCALERDALIKELLGKGEGWGIVGGHGAIKF